MDKIGKAFGRLNHDMKWCEKHEAIGFEEFLRVLTQDPKMVLRNVFQVFHDMIQAYVGEGFDEYPDDPESIDYVKYDFSKLLVEGLDQPFFADRLFANRLVNLAEALKVGARQNKIYIFEGPHGSGKSTFLNNLLRKFEEYANTDEGMRYEIVWRLTPRLLGNFADNKVCAEPPVKNDLTIAGFMDETLEGEYVEVPCPSHDNPILMIPKALRRSFLEALFEEHDFREELFSGKEYDWVFKSNPCTICSSIYDALLSRLKDSSKVYSMAYARPYVCNRRLGEGISVFNPGDKPLMKIALTNPMLQRRINALFKDSNLVKYIFSYYAKTNNGIYALMDIKSHNVDRLMGLHNIISEGVHKVEHVEESVNSLFMALMNPEDQKNVADVRSFIDRIEYINISYIMDLNTEVAIYRDIFGKHIDESFLPRVLHNFARVIISTRMNTRSESLFEWIGNPDRYNMYCDKNLQLLKMEIYTGYIPSWLTEQDRKRLNARRRRKIIAESETEGHWGFSERDAIKLFNDFYTAYARKDSLINMSMLCNFFRKLPAEPNKTIPEGFLESLLQMYNYTILQEVKESLYYYNEEQIAQEIQNYLFAVSFEIGAVVTSSFTGARIEVSEEFFSKIETRLFGSDMTEDQRRRARKDIQKEYAGETLPQEILLEGKYLPQTRLYKTLHERYVHNLKDNVLDPFLGNENFRRAIKEFDEEGFKTYDKKIREDVTFLIKNLQNKYHYSAQGAKEVCIYVIDNDLAKAFAVKK